MLWYREASRDFSYQRQRDTFFAGRTPLHTYLPADVQHAAVLAWTFGVRGAGRPAFGRLAGLGYAAAFFWSAAPRARSLAHDARARRAGGGRGRDPDHAHPVRDDASRVPAQLRVDARAARRARPPDSPRDRSAAARRRRRTTPRRSSSGSSARFPDAFTWETLPPSKQRPLVRAVGRRARGAELLALSLAHLRRRAEAARARPHAGAARPSCGSAICRCCARAPASALLTAVFRRARARAFRSGDDVAGARSIALQAGRAARDAAAVFRIEAGGLRARGARVRHQQRARRRQLGSPDDQGAHPRAAGPRAWCGTSCSGPRRSELHGARPDQVTVTGAQAYDHWFATRPSTDRARRSARASGCRPDRPTCSTSARRRSSRRYEVDVVRRWIEAHPRAAASRRCASAGILVRPHPQNAAQWAGRRSVGVRRRGDLAARRRQSDRPATRAASTTTRCITRTPSSASTPARSSSRASSAGRCISFRVPELVGHAGGHAALPAPEDAAACCGWPRRSTSTSRSWHVRSPRPKRTGRGCAVSSSCSCGRTVSTSRRRRASCRPSRRRARGARSRGACAPIGGCCQRAACARGRAWPRGPRATERPPPSGRNA